jgi:hypothetical protein
VAERGAISDDDPGLRMDPRSATDDDARQRGGAAQATFAADWQATRAETGRWSSRAAGALRASPLEGYAPGVLRALKLRGLVLAASSFPALCGCGAPARSSTSSPVSDPDEGGASGAERIRAPRAAGELDPASAGALGGLPQQLGPFRLDPYATVRAFGAGEPAPLERACDAILGPGCDDGHGLEHVVALRYVAVQSVAGGPLDGQRVDGRGGRATLDVIVSRYADAESAYARFTDDLIGERDPLELSARLLEVPGLAVLDAERVDGWLGRYIVGLTHSDPTEPFEQRVAAAAAALPEAARRLTEALPAEADLPPSVQRLPRAHRIPLGARLLTGDALGVPGVGRGAVGYYRDGDKRWRVLAIVRPDAESAKDVLATLGQSPAARRIEKAPLDALAFTERRLPAEPYVGWVVGQRHEVVYGVGDEAAVLPEFTPAEREATVKLSLLDKLAKLTKVHLE